MSKNSAKQTYQTNQEWLEWAISKKIITKKKKSRPIVPMDWDKY